jgi:beta-lactamase class A
VEERITEKNNRLKVVFSLILIFSIILNIILIIKIINPSNFFTGEVILTNPETNKNLANNIGVNQNYILHYNPLKEKILPELEKYPQAQIGFFIQDLQTGGWLGWNEQEGFAPASLLKVPIMMAVLKKVDRGELDLNDKITIRKEYIDTTYHTSYEGKENEEFTVEQLLSSMIQESDNTAKNALVTELLPYEIDEVFMHTGIPDPYLKENKDKTVSPRDYSRLFKSLYYSTFLSAKSSEFALKLATNTQIENLITQGVPPEVQVSHKFGIYYDKSLHDCGIVYHKKNPYLICIMTNNISTAESAELIRFISKETYNFVDSN